MEYLDIDYETRSSYPITNGVYRYTEAPDFAVLMAAYETSEGERGVIDFYHGENYPPHVHAAMNNPKVTKYAYNAQFERVVYSRQETPRTVQFKDPDGWHCLKVEAQSKGFATSLAAVGVQLQLHAKKPQFSRDTIQQFCKATGLQGVPSNLTDLARAVVRANIEHEPWMQEILYPNFEFYSKRYNPEKYVDTDTPFIKLTFGKELIQLFSIPRDGTFRSPDDYPVEYLLFKIYCMYDVYVQRAIREHMQVKPDGVTPWPFQELDKWRDHERIMDRGIKVDVPFCQAISKIINKDVKENMHKLFEILGEPLVNDQAGPKGAPNQKTVKWFNKHQTGYVTRDVTIEALAMRHWGSQQLVQSRHRIAIPLWEGAGGFFHANQLIPATPIRSKKWDPLQSNHLQDNCPVTHSRDEYDAHLHSFTNMSDEIIRIELGKGTGMEATPHQKSATYALPYVILKPQDTVQVYWPHTACLQIFTGTGTSKRCIWSDVLVKNQPYTITTTEGARTYCVQNRTTSVMTLTFLDKNPGLFQCSRALSQGKKSFQLAPKSETTLTCSIRPLLRADWQENVPTLWLKRGAELTYILSASAKNRWTLPPTLNGDILIINNVREMENFYVKIGKSYAAPHTDTSESPSEKSVLANGLATIGLPPKRLNKWYKYITAKKDNPLTPDGLIKTMHQFWAASEGKEYIRSLDKKSRAMWLDREDLKPHVRELLETYDLIAGGAYKKFDVGLAWASEVDYRIRGSLLFYATVTGRFAGVGVQPQNMPRPDEYVESLMQKVWGSTDAHELHITRVRAMIIKHQDDPRIVDALRAKLNNASFMGVWKTLIRSMFIPEAGHRFLINDYSAIEARVLAMVSGEQWRIDAFNLEGSDIYAMSYANAVNRPDHWRDYAKGGAEESYRKWGKVMELALGYGGGPGAIAAMGGMAFVPEDLRSDETLANAWIKDNLVDPWRQANAHISGTWYAYMEAFQNTVLSGAPVTVSKNGIDIIFDYFGKGVLAVHLPSGRDIIYRGVSVREEYDEEFVDQYGRPRKRSNVYYEHSDNGAPSARIMNHLTLTNNIVQGLARDLLVRGVHIFEKNTDKMRARVVLHVHDEAVLEVPTEYAETEFNLVQRTMAHPPKWVQASGVHVIGDGGIHEYYAK